MLSLIAASDDYRTLCYALRMRSHDGASHLYAVIAAPHAEPTFSLDLPPKWSRPTHVRLHAGSSDADVALAVASFATYGSTSPGNLEALITREFPRVAAGGLAAVDASQAIFPSCCAGLEQWREWFRPLEHGMSPWLGHDPDPYVTIDNDDFFVWADGQVDPSTLSPIHFTRVELVRALEDAERDLRAFARRLEQWAAPRESLHATELARKFLTLVGLDVVALVKQD